MITALAHGCVSITPVADPAEARRLAAAEGPDAALAAGERPGSAAPTRAALAALAVGRRYAADVTRLREHSPWARRLCAAGRGADVSACLRLDTTSLVPVYLPSVDKVVPGCR